MIVSNENGFGWVFIALKGRLYSYVRENYVFAIAELQRAFDLSTNFRVFYWFLEIQVHVEF
jgi:hypothetical protein